MLAGSVVLLVACSSAEEQAERAREAAQDALVRGQREAALAAIEDLHSSRPDTPEALLEHATLLVQAGEAPRAVWLLEDGVTRFSERDELRLALANAFLLVNDAARARAAAERIPADSEQHPRARVILAQAELQLGNLERALAILVDVESRYPDLPAMRLPRIAALLTERRFEEARAALEAARPAAESAATRAALRRLEINLYAFQSAQGEGEAAIAGLKSLVDADPDDVVAWHTLIQVLWNQRRPEEARDAVREALAADPDRLALYPLAAPLYAAFGNTEEVERTLRQFVDRSKSPTAYLSLAQYYAAREEEDRALELFREAIEAFPDEPMLCHSHAETLVAFGRLREARAELDRLERLVPGDPNVEYVRAQIELAEGDAAAALARLEKLIPELDHHASQFWLGRALELTGDLAGAERRYRIAILRNPADPAPYLAIIHLAGRRGDWRVVATHAQLLVQRAPGRFEGWDALIQALVNLGEAAKAEEVAQRAVERFPDRSEPVVLLAMALRTQERHADALARLDEAREQFGDTPLIAGERALTLGKSGRVEQGIAVARMALETNADSAQLHFALAQVLFLGGQAKAGAAAVDRALELDPDDVRPLRNRAEFRAATGRLDGARRDCEAYLVLRPDDAVAHYTLGVVHSQAGRPEQAIASYRRAAELDATAVAPRNNLAELLAERGDLDAALAAAQEAFRIAGDNGYVLDTLGWLYLRKGLVERSISVLEDARAAAPELPEAQLHLALAYREAGRVQEAQSLLSDLSSRPDGRPELRRQVDEALDSLR